MLATSITGHGDVTFQSWLLGGFQNITFPDALHVPKLAANLVSLGKLQQVGVSVHSTESGLTVSLEDDELFHASLAGSTVL